jgi:3-hydroxyisobutyrate dehydrogenase-like beta-hydroxyacid dehydrogenase
MSLQVCLLGFGEVGQALVGDFGARGLSNLAVWDVLFTVADSAPRRAAVGKPVRVAANVEDAVANADLVISAVTAAQDVAAARSVVPHLKRNAYFFDVNSVSPGVKVEVSQIVEAAGGRYIESAIMSPINPKRAASPMLLGGPHAAEFLSVARQLGFTAAHRPRRCVAASSSRAWKRCSANRCSPRVAMASRTPSCSRWAVC